jgi:ABC-type transport system involved in cytochrome bd biosynthesis fused ATPase/permease subunit
MTDVNLSQGQIQLLAIARAVVRKEDISSKLVFIDEATSSIDHDKDRELQTIMTETFADCTVVMISHRAHAFDNMHKVIRLSEGRILDISERNATSDELVVLEG